MVTRHTPPIEAQLGKEIQVRTPDGALVSWEDLGDYKWESDGTEDVQPSFPQIKIVQGTSTMEDKGRHGGDFWHSDTEEFESELTVVALVRRQTRALFSQGDPAAQCMSVDGRVPLPNQPLWSKREFADRNGQLIDVPAEPAACAECPFSQWGDDGTPPYCGYSEMLLVEREDGTLAQLRVGGKSLKPLRQFIARKCAPKKLPLYAYRLTLSTVALTAEAPARSWYELRIQSELMMPNAARAYSDRLKAERQRFETGLESQGATAEWQNDAAADDGFEE